MYYYDVWLDYSKRFRIKSERELDDREIVKYASSNDSKYVIEVDELERIGEGEEYIEDVDAFDVHKDKVIKALKNGRIWSKTEKKYYEVDTLKNTLGNFRIGKGDYFFFVSDYDDIWTLYE